MVMETGLLRAEGMRIADAGEAGMEEGATGLTAPVAREI